MRSSLKETTQVSRPGAGTGKAAQSMDLGGQKEDMQVTLQDMGKGNRIPTWTRGQTQV